MLRTESETGWWLITHPDHARLAGAFAEAWGNERFRAPEPRARVLYGISSHDDGWADRDAHPSITREGKPSAFSTELVGKYSAFEEIDLAEYLAVRERAVRVIAEQDPYAGLLVAIHTYDLLTNRADRSTIAEEQLPLLDLFLEKQEDIAAAAHRLDPAGLPSRGKGKRSGYDQGTLPAAAGVRQPFAVDLRGIRIAGESAASVVVE